MHRNTRLFIALILTFFTYSVFAQPANDECSSAIALIDIGDWCSDYEAYTTVAATAGGFSAATCFSGTGNDVWFRFKPSASDVTIIIRGNDPAAAGGSMLSPEVALYTGSCSGTINTEACAKAPFGQNVVSLHKGGLQLGEEYLIRVQGGNNMGTFQLCITNYNPPVEPGQDCTTAANLCDNTSFTVQKTNGGGNNTNELSGTCVGAESASTWFTWTASDSKELTFVLTPSNEPDDLDFAVFEIPASGCADKQLLLCNAAGESYPSPCMGPTGLKEGETDISEPAGCAGGNNGWVRPLSMVAGKTYALVVNNYSNSGSGFTVDFGSDATIEGPKIDFETDLNDKVCFGEPIVFTDKSIYSNGTIATWDWNFGVGGTPIASSASGPHTVVYEDTPGIKLASLKITSSTGCIVTMVKEIEVMPCCAMNGIESVPTLTHLKCDGGNDGSIVLATTTAALPVAYNWGFGGSTPSQNNLEAGDYSVTIVNAATCDTTLAFELTAPPKMVFDTIIQRPTCGGGTDGVLEIPTTGGVAPYEYSFNGSPYSLSNTQKDISNGLVTVGVRDANGCLITLEDIVVTELELLLNTNILVVDTPSCFGYTDGLITLGVLNGLSPYQYDFGSGFTSNNTLENVAAGNYVATVQDANLCKGIFNFEINDYPPLTLAVGSEPTSCYQLADGLAFAKADGGVGNYSYLWSNAVTLDTNINILGGAYFVTTTDGNGCEKITDVIVEEPEEVNVFVTGITDIICYGDATGEVGVDATGGLEPYLFAIDTSVFQSDTSFANILGGDHYVYVQDAEGCIGKDSVTIGQPEELIVQAVGDTTINLGYETNLNAFVFPQGRLVDYQWYPSTESFNNDSIPNPRLRPKQSGYYYVQVVDSTGCIAKDSVLIVVLDEKPVFGPTAFSPNGDGLNDYFTIFGGPAAVHIISLRVFDRYGNMVFEKKDYSLSVESAGWDGRYRGKKMRSDTYIWMAEIDFWDEKPVIVAGDVTLFR